jgi:hypothetical protein
MKFSLILCVMLLSFSGTAQKRTEIHKQELYKNVIFNSKVHFSGDAAENWILFIHGSGECGPIDGSSIDRVDKNGVLNLVANGYNVFAPQATCGVISDWTKIRWILIDYMVEKLGAKRIVITGLSQGGMEAVDWGWRYKGTAVKAIIVMCGKASYSPDVPRTTVLDKYGASVVVLDYSKYLDVPYLGVHGTLDKGVNYSDGLKHYNALVAQIGRTATEVFYPIIGGQHSSAWTAGYSKSNPIAGKYVYALIDQVFIPPDVKLSTEDVTGLTIVGDTVYITTDFGTFKAGPIVRE